MTDENLYTNKQDEQLAVFESLCLRCGECCGASTDPCAHLAKASDGKFYCDTYDNRLGPQRTVSGRAFTCVSIREVIRKGLPYLACGYAK